MEEMEMLVMTALDPSCNWIVWCYTLSSSIHITHITWS